MGAEEAADMRNELDMLREERKHLKRLVEARDEEEDRLKGSYAPQDSEAFDLLRRQRDELQTSLSEAREDITLRQQKLENSIKERETDTDRLKGELNSLEAQLEFEIRQHEAQLASKQAEIKHLEAKVDSLQKQLEAALEGEVIDSSYEDSTDITELQRAVQQLRQQCNVARIDRDAKGEEVTVLRREVNRWKHESEAMSPTVTAEVDMYKTRFDEANRRARNAEERSDDFQAQLNEANLQLKSRLQEKSSLEQTCAELQKRLESGVGGTGGDNELRREVAEKQKALWDLSDRLLALSEERDDLIQENASIKAGRLPEGPARSENPGHKQPERRVTTPEQKQQTSEGSVGGVSYVKLAEAEMNTMRVKMKLGAAEDEVLQLTRKLERTDAELAALRLSKAKTQETMSISKSILLPLPTGGDSELDRLRVEVQLKDAAFRRVSAQKEELEDALSNLTLKAPNLTAAAGLSETRDQDQLSLRTLERTCEKLRAQHKQLEVSCHVLSTIS
eukprot:GHVQ01013042.1.p1 GENE.GHVQ01013042.1~~GHVQ01013042.1.p1  ORF type:complete len:507 (-),score=118.10 GHVQ01013042.1:942-2462(-)